jgi:hypothetical protein
MTTMVDRITTFADVRHHPLTTGALVFVFWIAAAVLVATCHVELDALSASGSAVATVASLVLVSYAYTRLCARCMGIDHALGVGIAWFMLAIVVEITVTSRTGHGWYALIGSPERPLLRNVFMFVWIFAPALFARARIED